MEFTANNVSFGHNFAEFVVGNTYERIPVKDAKLDRTGQWPRVHDWTIYVEIVGGDVGVIDHVVFDCGPTFVPRKFIHEYPIRNRTTKKYRFQSRQQTYGFISVDITLVGVGGKELKLDYFVRRGNYREEHSRDFVDPGFHDQIKPRPIPDIGFAVRTLLPASRGLMDNVKIKAVTDHVERTNAWCFIHNHTENNFRIESTTLRGDVELDKCKKFAEEIHQCLGGTCMNIQVMVMVPNPLVDKVRKLCQNFIKYEDALDLIFQVPPDTNTKSNKKALKGCTNNKDRDERISSCNTIQQLCEALNPNRTQHYKLNLLNLSNDSHPYVEFCVLSFTSPAQIDNLVRFCLAFVHNSFRSKSPSSLKDDRDVEDQLDMLFRYVIKDRGLERNCRWFLQGKTGSSIDTPSDVSALTAPDQTLNSFGTSFDLSTPLYDFGDISLGDIDSALQQLDSAAHHEDMVESVISNQTGGIRKRPRHEIIGAATLPHHYPSFIPTPYLATAVTSQSKVNKPHIVKRHEIPGFTVRVLGKILKNINRGRSNQKDLRIQELQKYFKEKLNDCRGCLEIIVDGNPRILLIKHGGIKVSIEQGNQVMSQLSNDDLTKVFDKLNLPIPDDKKQRVTELDKFLDEVYSGIEVKGVKVKGAKTETFLINSPRANAKAQCDLSSAQLEGILGVLYKTVPDLALSPIPSERDERIAQLYRYIEELHNYVLIA